MFHGGRPHAYYRRGGTFEQTYRCLPASSLVDKPHLELGDKVLLPPSALARLATLRLDYPMLFELRNGDDDDDDYDDDDDEDDYDYDDDDDDDADTDNADASAASAAHQRVSHCGVLEFVAEEGTVVMPCWMMRNMRLEEGDFVEVKSAALPKGTYAKLQPHTADFFVGVSNPKAVLEKTLRSFSCLTTGDTVAVAYNGREYHIDIVETRPAPAVCIVETDCEVDFAPPLDYKEPEKPLPAPPPAVPAGEEGGDAVAEEEPEFRPFTGSAKRLDGKASKLQASGEVPSTAARSAAPSDSNKRANQQASSAPTVTSGAGSSTSSGSVPRQKAGKLVFGSRASSSKEPLQKAPPAKAEEEPTKKDQPKFQAFSGKSYSLRR